MNFKQVLHPRNFWPYLAIVLGVCAAAYSISRAWLWSIDFPVNDQLTQLELIRQFLRDGIGSTSWHDWTKPHAGAHRIAILRWAMALDYRYFSGNNLVIYTLTVVALAIAIVCYLRWIRGSKTLDTPMALICGSLVFYWVLNPSQILNMISPINNSWLIAHALISASLYLLLAPNRLTLWKAIAATLVSTAAAYTLFSGVVALAAVLLVIILRDSRIAIRLSIPILLLLFVLTNGYGNRIALPVFPDGSAVFAKYVAVGYNLMTSVWRTLGSPLHVSSDQLAIGVSALFSIYVLYLAVAMIARGWCAGDRYQRFMAFCVIMAAISMALTLSIVLGRWVFGLNSTTRYQTIISFFWLNSSLLFVIRGSAQSRWQQYRHALVFATMALFAIHHNNEVKVAEKKHELAKEFSQKVRTDRSAGLDYRELLPKSQHDYYSEYGDFLKRNELGYWSKRSVANAEGIDKRE